MKFAGKLGVDILVSGHTHRLVDLARRYGNMCVQPGTEFYRNCNL